MRSPWPRTFKKSWLERGDRFVDPSVNAFHGEVSVNEDRFGTSQPGLVAFECEFCLYVTSEILPPVKGAFERNIRQNHSA
jgi:hypothetical protein